MPGRQIWARSDAGHLNAETVESLQCLKLSIWDNCALLRVHVNWLMLIDQYSLKSAHRD